jgi:hypothetical protein
VKARRVTGLHPSAALGENAARVVRVRLEELCALASEALATDGEKALHDMRIAAKRLRYVLELTAFCFGPYARRATRRARELQELLGAIHDCDVLEPRVRAHMAALRDADASALAPALSWPPVPGAAEPRLAPERRVSYGALEALAVGQRARRNMLIAQLHRRWDALERGGFRARLLAALAEGPGERA